MKKIFQKITILCCILFGIIILTNYTIAQAATKDTSKPTITLTPNKQYPTQWSVKITLKATDASGIKTVKWASGKHGATYFKSKGTALKLTKNIANVSVKVNGIYSFYVVDKAGNAKISTITIANIDRKAPYVTLSYSVMNQVATLKVRSKDVSGIKSRIYLKGNVTDPSSEKWAKGIALNNTTSFNTKTSGIYSVLVTDKAGNKTVKTMNVSLEFRAVWISYLEFSDKGYTESSFKTYIDEMFDNSVALNMNAVIVQIRPMGDALYPSSYFPWSKYVSGEQGIDPGFDPLDYMVKAAHDRGLEFHAWLNPYRVTLNSTNYSSLSEDNPARIWYEDGLKENDRNVLRFGTNLYYNPASTEVQEMIVADIGDIVDNYAVDGIHFDDYFYPSLGSSYKTNFDSVEYYIYKNEATNAGETPMSIDEWRRENVNSLVRNVYATIKESNSSVRFGISPHGNISNLTAKDRYYVDVETWLSSSEYIDYIAPQIYWSFTHKVCPFDETVERWLSIRTSDTVSMYIGIANYKAKASLADDPEWKVSDDELMRQVEYSRETGLVDGYMFFRYDFFFKAAMQVEIDNLMSVLN